MTYLLKKPKHERLEKENVLRFWEKDVVAQLVVVL